MLVGTKLDDVENRKVSAEDAQEICRQFGCIGYFETSSSTGKNVDEAFFSVAARAFQQTEDLANSSKLRSLTGKGSLALDGIKSED